MKLPELVVHLNVANDRPAFVLGIVLLQFVDIAGEAIKMWKYDHLI